MGHEVVCMYCTQCVAITSSVSNVVAAPRLQFSVTKVTRVLFVLFPHEVVLFQTCDVLSTHSSGFGFDCNDVSWSKITCNVM